MVPQAFVSVQVRDCKLPEQVDHAPQLHASVQDTMFETVTVLVAVAVFPAWSRATAVSV